MIGLFLLFWLQLGVVWRPSSSNRLPTWNELHKQAGFEQQQAYNAIALNVDPKWYDRSSGWEGTTHQAALQFCASVEKVLCPYAAYCPLGPNSPIPYGGLKNERFGSLAPAVATGGNNMWIRVGKDEKGDGDVCTYVELEASWGQDKSNEEETRHIMCCKA